MIVVITNGHADAIARLRAIVAAVPAGQLAIQVREKQLDGGALLAFAREVVALGVPVWVNDRADVALAAGAHGVHLPERGLSIGDARRIAPGLAIGCSGHSREGVLAAAAAGAQLVQLGPIWETPGKGPPLGPGALAVRRELPRDCLLVAVGGIDSPERARAARDAGADAIAVIRAAWHGDPRKLLAFHQPDGSR